MSILLTMALMSTRSMICCTSTLSMIFCTSTRSTILSTSTRSMIFSTSTLSRMESMSMASTISGTMCSARDWANCSTLLPIGLGLMWTAGSVTFQ